jgi:hypothetical protein
LTTKIGNFKSWSSSLLLAAPQAIPRSNIQFFWRPIKSLLWVRCGPAINYLLSLVIKRNTTTAPAIMVKQTTTKATFRFMDLPRELRDNVYEFVRNDDPYVIDDGIRHAVSTERMSDPHVSVVNRLDTNLLRASRQIHAEYNTHASRDLLLLIQGHPSRQRYYNLPYHQKLSTIRRIKVVLNGYHSGDHALHLLPRWKQTVSQGIAGFCNARSLQIIAPLDLWDLDDEGQRTQDILEIARRFVDTPNLDSLTILHTLLDYGRRQTWQVPDKILAIRWTHHDGWDMRKVCIMTTEESRMLAS